jgi:hypothetical protein
LTRARRRRSAARRRATARRAADDARCELDLRREANRVGAVEDWVGGLDAPAGALELPLPLAEGAVADDPEEEAWPEDWPDPVLRLADDGTDGALTRGTETFGDGADTCGTVGVGTGGTVTDGVVIPVLGTVTEGTVVPWGNVTAPLEPVCVARPEVRSPATSAASTAIFRDIWTKTLERAETCADGRKSKIRAWTCSYPLKASACGRSLNSGREIRSSH